MADAIYFSKIEYREVIGYGNTSSIMLLNIPERELSYQVYNWKRRMPAIEGIQTEQCGNHTWTYSITAPAKRIRNEKTGFEPQMIKDEPYESEIAFSYAIKLTEEQMEHLLPYCNALDFEPYRDREMKMGEEGYIGYRDEVHLYFKARVIIYLMNQDLNLRYGRISFVPVVRESSSWIQSGRVSSMTSERTTVFRKRICTRCMPTRRSTTLLKSGFCIP